jgi:hypothetical protein
LLSGPPGGGKTTLLAGWCAAFRDGTPIFGKPANQLPWIGTLIADREARDTMQWYQAAGFPDIPNYSLLDDFSVKTAELRKPLAAFSLLTRIVLNLDIPPNGLLVLDPVAPWCGGDLNKYHLVMPAMIDLGRLCLERQITLLGLAHTGKQKADSKDRYQRPQDRILGSTALLGCSGTQMALVPPEDEDSPYEFTWVPHHAKQETFSLTRGTDGLFLLDAFQQEGGSAIPHPEVLECIPASESGVHLKMLRRVLVAKHIEISDPTLFRTLAAYLKLTLVECPAKGVYRRTPVLESGDSVRVED